MKNWHKCVFKQYVIFIHDFLTSTFCKVFSSSEALHEPLEPTLVKSKNSKIDKADAANIILYLYRLLAINKLTKTNDLFLNKWRFIMYPCNEIEKYTKSRAENFTFYTPTL